MGLLDKLRHKGGELRDRGRKAAGRAPHAKDTPFRDQAEHAKGALKQAGEHLKDAGTNIRRRLAR